MLLLWGYLRYNGRSDREYSSERRELHLLQRYDIRKGGGGNLSENRTKADRGDRSGGTGEILA